MHIPSSLYDLADSNTTTNLLPHVAMKSPIVVRADLIAVWKKLSVQIIDNNTGQTARYPFTIWIVTIGQEKLWPERIHIFQTN